MTDSSDPVMHCVYHPDRETYLRCNRCEQPICNKCAVQTPTGYRCKNCVRGQQKVFDNAQGKDYILAVVISLILSLLGSLLTPILGFFTIFVGPVVGGVTAEAVRWAIRRRRGQNLFKAAAVAAAIGSLPLIFLGLLPLLGGSFAGILGLVWKVVYGILVTSTLYYRLRGIQIR